MNDPVHVMPINDSAPHTDWEYCWCRPGIIIEGVNAWIYVHHSADGRELAESERAGR